MPTLKSPSVARITRLTPLRIEVLLGQLVGLADALGAGRAAAGARLSMRREDPAPSRLPWSAQHRAGAAGIGDDRDACRRRRAASSSSASDCLSSGSLFGSFIEPDVSIRNTRLARGRVGALDVVALDADAHELRPSRPRRRQDRDVGAERLRGAAGARIVIGEVVDHLLDPHRIGLRQDVPGSASAARRNRRPCRRRSRRSRPALRARP